MKQKLASHSGSHCDTRLSGKQQEHKKWWQIFVFVSLWKPNVVNKSRGNTHFSKLNRYQFFSKHIFSAQQSICHSKTMTIVIPFPLLWEIYWKKPLLYLNLWTSLFESFADQNVLTLCLGWKKFPERSDTTTSHSPQINFCSVFQQKLTISKTWSDIEVKKRLASFAELLRFYCKGSKY